MRAIPAPLSPSERGVLAEAGMGNPAQSRPPSEATSPRNEERLIAGLRGIPGIEEVLSAFPAELRPSSKLGFLLTPQIDLDGLSPLAWLAQRRHVERITELARDLLIR